MTSSNWGTPVRENDGVKPHAELVDEVVREQRAHQFAAGRDDDVASGLLLQRRDLRN